MKARPCLLLAAIVSFWANAGLAQGTMLATWHNQAGPGPFQAAFQVYDSEMAPGTALAGSALFRQTLTVTSPDHTFLFPSDGSEIFSYRGQPYPPPYTSYYINGDASLDLLLAASWTDASNPSFLISLSGTTIGQSVDGTSTFHQSGFWTFAAVPEPSMVSLASFGMAALLCRKLRFGR
jgi:hypothetical protein